MIDQLPRPDEIALVHGAHRTEFDSSALIESARALGPHIYACRDLIERDRRLPPTLVSAMADRGLFRLLTPRALGGLEVDPFTAFRVIEEIARVDGAAGWAVAIGNSGFFTAWVDPEAGEEIVGPDPSAPGGGVLAPTGRATIVPGGYRVTGRWPFASGCQYSTWLIGGCLVYDGEQLRSGADGEPEARILFFPRADCEIIDTWSACGLRGSGSHDFAVHDVFVPRRRSFSRDDSPLQPGPLYRVPLRALLSSVLAAVPLGIARAAIEAIIELGAVKKPSGLRCLLRDRAMVQAELARAEALVRSGRAFLFETLSEVWAEIVAGRAVSLQQHALLRLAATHATLCAAQAVDLMYQAGGGSSVYTGSRLERAFRDVHVATQHMVFAPVVYEPVGRVLFGLEPDLPIF
jgi:alkylation response protein AidB-like acyl-CoA dehydrogenase